MTWEEYLKAVIMKEKVDSYCKDKNCNENERKKLLKLI